MHIALLKNMLGMSASRDLVYCKSVSNFVSTLTNTKLTHRDQVSY